jgi:hypothetical protein
MALLLFANLYMFDAVPAVNTGACGNAYMGEVLNEQS